MVNDMEETYGKCNYIFCRYNKDRLCTDKEQREWCISVKHNKLLMRDKRNMELMENVIEE